MYLSHGLQDHKAGENSAFSPSWPQDAHGNIGQHSNQAGQFYTFWNALLYQGIWEWSKASSALFRRSFGCSWGVRQTTGEEEGLPTVSMDSKTHTPLSGYLHSTSTWLLKEISRYKNSRWFYLDLNTSVGLPTRGKPGKRSRLVWFFSCGAHTLGMAQPADTRWWCVGVGLSPHTRSEPSTALPHRHKPAKPQIWETPEPAKIPAADSFT